ncbi:disease resistance TIR-NBS-LRR class family protein [Tanacetum coccineum]
MLRVLPSQKSRDPLFSYGTRFKANHNKEAKELWHKRDEAALTVFGNQSQPTFIFTEKLSPMEMEGTLVTSSGFKSPSTDVPAKGWIYGVFLSFRREDTRTNFVDHLYEALDRAGIYTFKDDVKLLQGKPISWELVKVIEQSKLDKHNKIVVICELLFVYVFRSLEYCL